MASWEGFGDNGIVDSACRVAGTQTTLREVLLRWQEEGCTIMGRDWRGRQRFVCVQVPQPFLHCLKFGIYDIVCVGDLLKPRCAEIRRFLAGRDEVSTASVKDLHMSLDPSLFRLDAD